MKIVWLNGWLNITDFDSIRYFQMDLDDYTVVLNAALVEKFYNDGTLVDVKLIEINDLVVYEFDPDVDVDDGYGTIMATISEITDDVYNETDFIDVTERFNELF